MEKKSKYSILWFRKKIKKLHDIYIDLNKEDKLIEQLAGTYCHANTPKWYLFDLMIETINEQIEDEGDWLSWYIYDNDWGKKKMKAVVNEKEIIIDRIEKLWHCIQS
jgi:hypothetical protein